MQVFLALSFKDDNVLLSPEESKHCIKVLRHKKGDAIHVIDGKGNLFDCTLVETNPEACVAKIVSKKNIAAKKNYSLHIAISQTKNPDRIEWMVEKCTELGVDEISFIVCARTEKKGVKIERIQKIAESAVKQSIQNIIPEISEPVPFKEFIRLKKNFEGKKYIAYCGEGSKKELKEILSPEKILVLIGPEGDFTEEEVKLANENGFQNISLGEARLRTETAGLFVAAGFRVI